MPEPSDKKLYEKVKEKYIINTLNILLIDQVYLLKNIKVVVVNI